LGYSIADYVYRVCIFALSIYFYNLKDLGPYSKSKLELNSKMVEFDDVKFFVCVFIFLYT